LSLKPIELITGEYESFKPLADVLKYKEN